MKRYETIDALRGVAALAVVAFHLGQVRLEPNLVPHGYLAVDFFFVLSGFVVAHAYENALLGSLTWRSFFMKRILRLHPLAFLGASTGFVVLLLKWHISPDKVDPLPTLVLTGALNTLLLPVWSADTLSRGDLFPTNGPLWSLFFEMLVNLLWARFGVRAKTSSIAAFALANGLALVFLATDAHGLNIGFSVDTFWGGAARVCFSFPLGVVIFRLHRKWPSRSIPGGALLLTIALIFVLTFPGNVYDSDASMSFDMSQFVPWWDILCVLFILPLLVVLGIGQETRTRLGTWLGDLSYPIYVMHFPILLAASGLHQTILSEVNVDILSIGTYISVLTIAAAALYFYDQPARRALFGFVYGTSAEAGARALETELASLNLMNDFRFPLWRS